MELGRHNEPFQRKAVDVVFPAEANSDFPVAMQVRMLSRPLVTCSYF